ncbi:MAG: hypothetical protein JMJ93_00835 [Synergistaceae bacterium]|jgi:hypothetical protein|nr:hypothetical protein [Synergistaceae bacterium]
MNSPFGISPSRPGRSRIHPDDRIGREGLLVQLFDGGCRCHEKEFRFGDWTWHRLNLRGLHGVSDGVARIRKGDLLVR